VLGRRQLGGHRANDVHRALPTLSHVPLIDTKHQDESLAVLLQLDCSVGRGDHYIEYGGYTYRTLDGADPEGTDGDSGEPGNGCQFHIDSNGGFLPLPAGWELAPEDTDSKVIIRTNGWNTHGLIVTTGSYYRCWHSANNGYYSSYGYSCCGSLFSSSCEECYDSCGEERIHPDCSVLGCSVLQTSSDPSGILQYTAVGCNSRVLIRCGVGPQPCTTLPVPDGMAISYSNGQEYGSTAWYSCTSAAHVMSGDGTRRCLGFGSWGGAAPSYCGCAELPAVDASTIAYSNGQAIGSVATHTCNSGNAPIGEASRTCGVDGSWSGAAPLCVRCQSAFCTGIVCTFKNAILVFNTGVKYGMLLSHRRVARSSRR
jgi:hypothetical protein